MIVDIVLLIPAVLISLYLLVLTLLSGVGKTGSRPTARYLKFDVIAHAHNEAASIEAVIANLMKLDIRTERESS